MTTPNKDRFKAGFIAYEKARNGGETNDESLFRAMQAACAEKNSVIAELWMLLDDIDTLSDIAKSDYKLFAERCYAIQQKRHAIISGDQIKLKTQGEQQMTIDELIERLPLSGRWHFSKTLNSSLGNYCASWEDNIGDKTTSCRVYGDTPNQAMEKLVLAIRGVL